jgi:hypothetical protein
MKKLAIALMSVIALSSSVAFAEDGGDRVIERQHQNMKSAMEAHQGQNSQLASSGQLASQSQE